MVLALSLDVDLLLKKQIRVGDDTGKVSSLLLPKF
jgi:hypothetical protein